MKHTKQNKLKAGIIFCLILLFSLHTALIAGGVKEKESQSDSSSVQVKQTRLFTDSSGRQVELPVKIDRIAVSGPLTQIMVFALAPEKMVGISSPWDKTAEQYLSTEHYQLPVMGQLYGSKGSLNLESLLAAKPDILIDIGEPKKNIAADMDELQQKTGLPVIHITAFLNSSGEAFRTLGKLIGKEKDAEVLAAWCERIYASVNKTMERVGDKRTSLLYCVGSKGINVIARGSFQAELINMVSDNLAVVENPSAKGSGNEVDMEQILLWNPDVIVFASDSIFASVKDDPLWQKLKAIKTNRFYETPNGPYNWFGFPPSVQRHLGLALMASLLYPGYTDLDLRKEVCTYYELFYHKKLSDEQFNKLTANSIGKK